MALYGVPWAIGGGAQHSPEVARNMLHIATMRTHGIVGTSDFRVGPTPTPGSKVRVNWGSALIRKDEGPESQQTYSAYAEQVTDISVAATGSSGPRSDLVILRIEDAFMEGSPWQAPADVKNGPYVHLRILPGVPAGTTTLAQAGRPGDTAIVLARLDIPANTATITSAMIVDLRRMAMPRQETQTNLAVAALPATTLTSTDWTNWISSYNPGNIVPEWATHAQIRFWLGGIYTVGPCDGSIRAELWAPNYIPAIVGPEQAFDQDIPVAAYGGNPSTSTGGGAARFSLFGGGYGPVHQWRGQYVYHRIGAKVIANRPDRSPVTVDGKSSLMFDVTFYEKPI